MIQNKTTYAALVAPLFFAACASVSPTKTVRDPYDTAIVAIASAWTIAHDLVSRTCNARLSWVSEEISRQIASGQITTREDALAYATLAMSTCSAAAKAISDSRQALDALLRLHAAGQGQPAYCVTLQGLQDVQRAADKLVPLPSTFFTALEIAKSYGGCR